jgi:hypothetical protein
MATKRPKVPPYTPAPTPEKPKDAAQMYLDILTKINGSLVDSSNTSADQQSKNTTKLNKTLVNAINKGTRQVTKNTFNLESRYAPQYADLYDSILDKSDPGFRETYEELGQKVRGDLARGTALDPELAREIEQDIRAGQDARGNSVGPAPTADEAFRKASARQTMYQNRMDNAGKFLATRAPTDMHGSIRGATTATQTYNPQVSASFYDPSTAMTVTGLESNNEQNYFRNLLSSYTTGQAAQYQNYNTLWNRYLFDEYANRTAPADSWMTRMFKGASTGASEGSIGGPWGAIGGAAGGAVDGAFNGPIYQAHDL